MRISSKSKCAILFMVDLAKYNTGEPVCLKEVAKRRQISEKFLEQSISILNNAGLVRSVRGPRGGYMLNISPSELTVGMILRKVENNMFFSNSVDSDTNDVTMKVCEKLEDAIEQVVDGICLRDLVEWEDNQVFNYYI
ncbi:MAG: Rrf2 family transcriptional regulator [Lachnospiraceae bacterium]|nr:Rrf2 family transcriptional regulator [Lachnospiraceae bacterium]MBQ2405982.1 Rrf2 family transcriptional regulator [Lachnospiraceae bacterium]MEE0918816.1 Rrf2 family transcriptional regulator [Lachnospiraceae bacterium]